MTGPIGSRVPAGWARRELAELGDRELLGIVRSLPRFSQRRIAAYELLVSRYRALVWSCVQRYRHGPEPTEELMQAGYVGLVAAINNFDPAVGCSLAAYADPHITGEIKRYFRDERWQVHVARPVKDLAVSASPGCRSPGSSATRSATSAGACSGQTRQPLGEDRKDTPSSEGGMHGYNGRVGRQ